MGFFKPAWQSKNWKKAIEAIKNINEQNILVEIAMWEGPSDYGWDDWITHLRELQGEAVSKIKDKNTLYTLAFSAPNIWTRKFAIQKITDTKLLTEIAQKTTNWTLKINELTQHAAFERLEELKKREEQKKPDKPQIDNGDNLLKKIKDQETDIDQKILCFTKLYQASKKDPLRMMKEAFEYLISYSKEHNFYDSYIRAIISAVPEDYREQFGEEVGMKVNHWKTMRYESDGEFSDEHESVEFEGKKYKIF